MTAGGAQPGPEQSNGSVQDFDMSDLLIAPRGDGSIVLHVPSGTYLQLDSSATTVLTLVGETGIDGAATELVRRYGLQRSAADADVARVVTAIIGARTSLTGNPHRPTVGGLSLIHISEPTRQAEISYAVFCLK